MKTIRQIAIELGVSKQAIQKRISREPLCTRIQPHITVKGKVKYIYKDGEALIREAFLNRAYRKIHTIDHKLSTDELENSVYNSSDMGVLLDVLRKELKIKNNQIAELIVANRNLTTALENATDSLKASHVLHSCTMCKLAQQEPEAKNIRRKGLFSRLFGWRNK